MSLGKAQGEGGMGGAKRFVGTTDTNMSPKNPTREEDKSGETT